MSVRSTARLVAFSLVVVCFALYARGIQGAFVIDDRTFFVENDDLTSLRLQDAGTVFVRPTNAWGDFQPVRDLLFLLEFRAFGRATVGYHLVSILLYCAACVLAFALARAIIGREGDPECSGAGRGWPAIAVAVLFAVHPAHAEVVAYISGQKELLAAVFSLASMLAFLRAFEAPERRAVRLAAGAVLYGLAILSKQTAIMLAVLVPLLYLESDREARPPWGRMAGIWGAVQVPALLWMLRSREAFQALWGTTSALNARPILERIPLALKVLGAHSRLAIWPHPLSFGYPFDGSPNLDGNLVAGVVTVALLALVGWRWRRERAVVFGAATFLLFLVPVLQLHGSLNNASIYDRYLFLPVFGLALMAERFAREWAVVRAGAPRAYVGLLAALAVAGAVATVAYVPAFADDVAVTRNTFERYPEWSRAPFEYAYSLVEAGRVAEARDLLARDASLASPAWVRPYLLGWAKLEEGRAGEALLLLLQAQELAVAGGYFPFPAIPLGRAMIQLGRLDDAEVELRRALATPIYQPLEQYHARALLSDIAGLRGGEPVESPR